ncbi:MAG TPA: serine protease [Xanthobacteraceae bacterium]|nr:serine protease [Xanthobacteraceae bacterium]
MRGPVSLFVVLAILGASGAEASCVDPGTLTHATVSISRYFSEAERASEPDVIGVQGAGWFLSPSHIVTVGHVTEGMKLAPWDWTTIDIRDGEETRTVAARLARIAGSGTEKLAVIELQHPVPNARVLATRSAPLAPEERVVTIVHAGHHPRSVSGRFVQTGEAGPLTNVDLLEMYDGRDRLAIDHGASGAPVLDCRGEVAAVISNVFVRNIQFASRDIRTSTSWGNPNVVSVPIQELTGGP